MPITSVLAVKCRCIVSQKTKNLGEKGMHLSTFSHTHTPLPMRRRYRVQEKKMFLFPQPMREGAQDNSK